MSTDMIVIILEIVVVVLLIGVNIWIVIRRRKKTDKNNIAGFQYREMELNRRLENKANASVDMKYLRPYEERYSTNTREPSTMVGGIRIELRVDTPISSKKYLTMVDDKLEIGTGQSNGLILDSSLAAEKEAVIIRENNDLIFQKLNGGSPILVERGRSRKELGSKPIKIHSQDCFRIQDVVLKIQIE